MEKKFATIRSVFGPKTRFTQVRRTQRTTVGSRPQTAQTPFVPSSLDRRKVRRPSVRVLCTEWSLRPKPRQRMWRVFGRRRKNENYDSGDGVSSVRTSVVYGSRPSETHSKIADRGDWVWDIRSQWPSPKNDTRVKNGTAWRIRCERRGEQQISTGHGVRRIGYFRTTVDNNIS